MAGLVLKAFGGFSPRVAPHLLNDTEGTKAINSRLFSGTLTPWRQLGSLTPAIGVPVNTRTIYRAVLANGDSQWFSWTSDVDVVKSPLSDTQEYRLIYTGDGAPKKTNRTLAGAGSGSSPADYLNLGVPAPASAPSVARNGAGSTSPETRVYTLTYVSTFGDITEESAPGPASAEVVVYSGDSVDLSSIPAAPAGKYNITHVRVYRSVTGSATGFLFVKEIPIGTATTNDALTAAQLGEALATTTWTEPPADLHSLVAMPNGILAGISGSEVCFSEPYYPHAWPVEYRMSLETEGVGLGVFGQTVVVMTKGRPYLISGVSSGSMSQEVVSIYEPCISKRSIVSESGGVTYISPNGIMSLTAAGPQLLTQNVLLKEDLEVYAPSTIVGAAYSGRYFGFFSGASIEEFTDGGIIFDRMVPNAPFTLTSIKTRAAYVDQENSSLYLVDAEDNQIKLWEGDQADRIPYEWKSKRFNFPRPINFGAIEVDAEFDDIAEADLIQEAVDELESANQAIFSSTSDLDSTLNTHLLNEYQLNGSLLATIPAEPDDRYMLLSVFAEGELKQQIQMTQKGIYRLVSGYKSDTYEFQINGNIGLRHIKIAETVKELKTL